ncbi:hypothetical protein [Lactobacillus sp.]|uniref:hypothetical protein n=1 Tax=Lactobacillus sp. TaxID=1591 RepID=UPI0019C838F8|nr:hypothetical protein [Lactobacillus sp.]MBD5430518.1 hypothetical protein [Lactobacillus sp.]MBD5430809.1 hypothetical protein [Lactobacillus sp.]
MTLNIPFDDHKLLKREYYCGYIEVLPSDKIFEDVKNLDVLDLAEKYLELDGAAGSISFMNHLVYTGDEKAYFLGMDTENLHARPEDELAYVNESLIAMNQEIRKLNGEK